MKTSIQVGGGFPLSFRIGEQLHRRNSLDRIVTTYPYSIFRRKRPERIPRRRFKTVPIDLIKKPYNKTPLADYLAIDWPLNQAFDSLASRRIGDADLLVGWPGSSLRGIRRANEKGLTTVVATDNANVTPAINADPAFEDLTIPDDPDEYVFQRREIRKELDRYSLSGGVEERYVRKSLKEYIEADYLVVPTQYVKDALIALGFEESKITKIPFGVDTDLFSTSNGRDETDALRLLFVGGIRYRKGIQYLLQAIDGLDDIELELTIVGGNQANLEDIDGDTDSIEYVGYVDHKELPEYYAAADAFVFPSILEGFGSVVLEAMASGLPVITTYHTGGVEVIEHGENGYLVPARDVEALQKHIRNLAENPADAEAIGQAARVTMEARTWDDYGDDVYRALKRFHDDDRTG